MKVRFFVTCNIDYNEPEGEIVEFDEDKTKEELTDYAYELAIEEYAPEGWFKIVKEEEKTCDECGETKDLVGGKNAKSIQPKIEDRYLKKTLCQKCWLRVFDRVEER